jgi:hypothetical protein
MENNKRQFGRFDTELKAHLILLGNGADGHECTVINMSRKGIGIKFHAREEIAIGTPIRLEVFVPEKSVPTSVQGVLKWIEERGDILFGGIECTDLLDEMKFSKVD